MATSRTFRIAVAAVATTFLSTAALVACGSSDDNPAPGTPVFTLDGGGTPTPDASVSPDGSGGNDSGITPDTGIIADTGPLPDVDAAACTRDSGCWSCTPESVPQFLNQCTGSQCTPFDNVGRVPGYDGGLPLWGQ
jgi:hypothetical protein